MPYPLLLHGKHATPPPTYRPFGEWLVPWRFTDSDSEYETLQRSVGLIDFSTQALIEVQGNDRVSFLQRLLTNDISRLAPGTGCQAALLTPKAKLTFMFLVLADDASLWLLCDATRAALALQTLDQYLFSEQVTLTNHERRDAVLALQGPRTMELLTSLIGTVVSLPNPGDHVTASVDGVPVRIIRHSLTDAIGVLCLIPGDHTRRVWETMRQSGLSCDLNCVGWETLNTARIEAGIPWFGIDIDESHLLPETVLETVVASNTKGCYIGQEIIARMQTYGSANKKLMGLRLDGINVPEAGDRILRGSDELGWVTSACFSPALKLPIAMGYVKRAAYHPGTAVEVEHEGNRLAATVAERPLVPQKEARSR